VNPLARRRDDTGSLPIALLITLVGVSLSALLVPIVVNQFAATRETSERVRSLHAAQAGIDVVLAQIRASGGDRTKLPPCTLEGDVGDGRTRYRVNVRYLPVDPKGRTSDTAWLDANDLDCNAVAINPMFALLSAEGTDVPTGAFTAADSRRLHATYTFRTTNENVPGGAIRVYKPAQSSPDLCIDAGSPRPAAGTNVQMQPCDPLSEAQRWGYLPNLTIALMSTRTGGAVGMCLDAGSPQAAGNRVQVWPCSTPSVAPRQQWSSNDAGNFEGTNDGVGLNGHCFNVEFPDQAGSFLVLGNGVGCGGPYDTRRTFSPDPSAGAGAASAANMQLVNYQMFGRCLDLTNWSVESDAMIAWPCKQAPNPANVGANQKWTLPTAVRPGERQPRGAIGSVFAPDHCLYSPRSDQPEQFVSVQPCGGDPNFDWTVHTVDVSDYRTAYTITDADGRCLVPADPNVYFYPTYQGRVPKVVVRTCDGSKLQKWNAPPDITNPLPLKDYAER
jgi:hypothetical protein